ncbi:MAG: diacylglycerol kinase [Candidatus Eremiobacteraeota bacterium]|nr:diacylglycerol kinase [Candidatus Eremiobacteraeota bacterium]
MALLSGRAFVNAANGIAHAWRTQQNFRIQVVLAIVALLVFGLLRVPLASIALLALTIGLVLALEVMNTAVEALVDLVSPEMQPLARAAKDAAAGAVLLGALGALGVGVALLAAALGR